MNYGPNNIQQGLNASLYNKTEGFTGEGAAEKNAQKAMKAATTEYEKELGIYKPTLWERFKSVFKKSA